VHTNPQTRLRSQLCEGELRRGLAEAARNTSREGGRKPDGKLGFMKSTQIWPFGSPRSFGSPGSGGSLGFADPEAGVGYGYVTSQMGTALTGDPRDVALRDALYAALRSSESMRGSS
jgi:CubicO group peptidase (beta-lactamase class C family)